MLIQTRDIKIKYNVLNYPYEIIGIIKGGNGLYDCFTEFLEKAKRAKNII